ncbi:hypothetical protein MSPP1_002252 [Malassezia sp. CBS 17886]|nr:hypothetical protein MSPP1_002252 [Malassezia sp. CBS 17886]
MRVLRPIGWEAVRSGREKPAQGTQMYVGPPDPVSQLRPVVYASSAGAPAAALSATHPYSLAEFALPPTGVARRLARQGITANTYLGAHLLRVHAHLESAQLQSRLQSLWLDLFNQRFWTDNNIRFQNARAAYEAQVPQSTDLSALAPLYHEWLAVNSGRLRQYNQLLWRGTARVAMAQGYASMLQHYARFITWVATR